MFEPMPTFLPHGLSVFTVDMRTVGRALVWGGREGQGREWRCCLGSLRGKLDVPS